MGMRTWAALFVLAAMMGVVGCDSDAPKKPSQDARWEQGTTVLLRGRLVHVGGPPPGTAEPVSKGLVRGRSSEALFRVGVDKDGRFAVRVRPGRYEIDGSQAYNGAYPCHTESSKFVTVKDREVAVTVYCDFD